MGIDSEWSRWLAGVAVSLCDGAGGGVITSRLASINSYFHFRPNERSSFWGTLGYGSGSLPLILNNANSLLDADLTNAMVAFGGRGVLSHFDNSTGQFELALRSYAMLTHTQSDATIGLAAGRSSTSRVRMLLEGAGAVAALSGTLELWLEGVYGTTWGMLSMVQASKSAVYSAEAQGNCRSISACEPCLPTAMLITANGATTPQSNTVLVQTVAACACGSAQTGVPTTAECRNSGHGRTPLVWYALGRFPSDSSSMPRSVLALAWIGSGIPMPCRHEQPRLQPRPQALLREC